MKIVERNDKENGLATGAVFNIKNEIESKKFCVDPQLTSYDVLYSIIAQAFSLNE